MIKFFRKIRQQLLTENKVSKYLIYAIGEIVLVVIGILIALQINNWNEYQKERKTESKVLKEVAENLEANILRLQSLIERGNIDNQASDVITSVIDNNLSYSDSLNTYFYFALNPVDEGSFLSYVGFESLKNEGFEIIHDDQLKKEIINLFEGIYRDLQAKYNRTNLISTPDLNNFREQHFLFQTDSVRQQIGHMPLDFDNLIKNKHFKSKLASTKAIRLWINSSLLQSLEETHRILQLIKAELMKSD
ncbi:DUF6090 family protein [Algoriphagus sp. SE2]|uniref:DUF6090 family protein n=1 Tax=Algoriphagus sp. SE2 TaxID=3141536 RepID=UPI0031CD1A14